MADIVEIRLFPDIYVNLPNVVIIGQTVFALYAFAIQSTVLKDSGREFHVVGKETNALLHLS